MREFTNHKAQLTLGMPHAFHLETLNLSGTHPEATLTDFERHLRDRVDALEAELEANESAAEAAVLTKPLAGPLADPERQRAFKHQESQRPSVPVGVACQTAGGRPKKEPHFLRATDADRPARRRRPRSPGADAPRGPDGPGALEGRVQRLPVGRLVDDVADERVRRRQASEPLGTPALL